MQNLVVNMGVGLSVANVVALCREVAGYVEISVSNVVIFHAVTRYVRVLHVVGDAAILRAVAAHVCLNVSEN